MRQGTNIDVHIYLNKYLKKVYPMYCREFGSDKRKQIADFNLWINDMVRELRTMGINNEDILNAEKDTEIDKLVDKYAKENFPLIRDNFDLLRDYIRKVIVKNTKHKDSDDLLDMISMDIAMKVSSGHDNISELIDKKYNTKYYNMYLHVRNEVKKNFYNYAKKVVSSSGKDVFDKQTLDKIYNDIASEMLKSFGFNKSYADDEFLDSFERVSNKIMEKVERHVRKVIGDLTNNLDLLTIIPDDKIVSDMLSVVKKGELNAVAIIDGRLDDLIRGYALEQRKRESKYDDIDVINYIYNELIYISDSNIIEEEMKLFAAEVYVVLMGDGYNYSADNIMNHECDNLIEELYEKKYYNIDRNSSKSTFKPSFDFGEDLKKASIKSDKEKKANNDKNGSGLLKYRVFKAKMSKFICLFLILMVLISSISLIARGIGEKKADEEAQIRASMLNNFNNFDDDEYKAIKIINYNRNLVDNYGISDVNYKNLGFYYAYNSISWEDEFRKLDQMEKIFDEYITKVEEEFESTLYTIPINKDKCGVYCFLDYVYGSLGRMGFEDIKNDRYQKTLKRYKLVNYSNSYGVPVQGLSDEEKEIIREVMKKYVDYCENEELGLGYLLGGQRPEELYVGSSSRRGI